MAQVNHSSAQGRIDRLSLDDGFLRRVAWCWIAVAGAVFFFDLFQQTKSELTNGAGRPFGDDFINYWSAAKLTSLQRTGEIYDWMAFHRFQESVTGGPLDFYHYSYPPVLLIVTLPLATLPYVPALAAWLVAGWYAFYRALRLALPDGALLLALATPAVFINAMGAQNGVWTAALFGGGLCLLAARPIIAGILFGLLLYKPHLAILIPVALVAGRQWTTLLSAAITVAALAALSVFVFGVEIWADYFRNATLLRGTILEDGTGVWHRMVSVFVFARRLGAGVEFAYAIQIVAGLSAAVVVALAWFRDKPAPLRYSLLVIGSWLATPYLQDYDLVVGAFVIAWLVGRSRAKDMAPEAVVASVLVLVLPILSVSLANVTGFAWGPLFLVPAFVIVARMAASAPQHA
jgi:hypothetical protein